MTEAEKRADYERAISRHRKASPAHTRTLRRTVKLIACTLAMSPKINTEAMARAAARHVHPRHKRRGVR